MGHFCELCKYANVVSGLQSIPLTSNPAIPVSIAQPPTLIVYAFPGLKTAGGLGGLGPAGG